MLGPALETIMELGIAQKVYEDVLNLPASWGWKTLKLVNLQIRELGKALHVFLHAYVHVRVYV